MNYRGLRRWIWPQLVVLLVLGAGFAGALYGIILTLMLGVGAAATATAGLAVIGGAACTLLLGYIGGFWGLMRAKSATISAFRAKPLPDSHGLVEMTNHLAGSIGLPPPRVYVYPSDDINAWATGSSAKQAAIGLSQGAVDQLEGSKLAGIVAHELGHIASGDMVRMQFAISFQNAVVLMARVVGLQRPARNTFGIVGEIGVKWLSRRREYWADAVGAALTSPATMTELLQMLETERPSSKHKKRHQLLFHWNREWLFRSHPSIVERCRAIESGSFIASVTQRLGRSVPSRPAPLKPVQMPARPMDDDLDIELYEPPPLPRYQFGFWSRWSDEALAAMMFVVGVPVGAVGFHIVQPKPTPSNPAQVAGWQRSLESPTRPSSVEPIVKSSPPPIKVASLEKPVPVPSPAPPPESTGMLPPKFEKLGAADGCIAWAGADHAHEERPGKGPGRATLKVIKLPLSEPMVDLTLQVVGGSIANCWGKYGAQQEEPNMMKRAKLTYDVWFFSGGDNYDTECGVLTAPRRLDHRYAGIAAYCREMK